MPRRTAPSPRGAMRGEEPPSAARAKRGLGGAASRGGSQTRTSLIPVSWRRMLEPFQLPFVQRGIVEVADPRRRPAGLIGTWIVLRGLAFYAHAVGTAAFPGLVLADGLGFAAVARRAARPPRWSRSPSACWRAARARATATTALTALVLVAALAVGRDPRQRRLPLGRQRRDAALRQPAARRRRRLRLRRRQRAPSCSSAGLVLGQRWLATGLRPGRRRAPSAPARRLPDIALLALVALVAVAALSTRRRAAGHRAARRPGRHHAARLLAPAPVAAGHGRARGASRGSAGLWLSVQVNAPPGPTIAVLAGGVFAAVAAGRALARAPRRPPAAVAAAALGARWPAGAAPTRRQRGARPGQGRRHHDPARRLRPRRRRRARPRSSRSCSPTPTRTTTSRARRTCARRPTPTSCSSTATSSTAGWATSSRRPAVTRRSSTSARASRSSVAGESARPEASRYDPHWWHDPRNARGGRGGDPRRADARPTPAPRDVYARNAAAYLARLRSLDRGHRRAACAAWRRAQRKLVTDHDAFGYFARRYGITVVGAVIPSQTTQAQPSAGDVARLSARHPARARQGGLPRELDQPQARPGDRAPDRRDEPTTTLYGDTLGPEGLAAAPPTWGWSAPTPTRWCAASPAASARGCADRGRSDRAARSRHRGPGRRLRRPRPCSRDVTFALRAGERDRACWGPTAAARRRCSACCSASSRPWPGTLRAPAALRRRAADRALAAGLPGQRARRRADGRDLDAAVVAAPRARASAARARAALDDGRARRAGRTRPSATSRAASASACSSRARWCRTRG